MYDSCAEVIRSYGSMMFYVIVPIGKNGAGEVKISGSNQLATYCNVQDQNIWKSITMAASHAELLVEFELFVRMGPLTGWPASNDWATS